MLPCSEPTKISDHLCDRSAAPPDSQFLKLLAAAFCQIALAPSREAAQPPEQELAALRLYLILRLNFEQFELVWQANHDAVRGTGRALAGSALISYAIHKSEIHRDPPPLPCHRPLLAAGPAIFSAALRWRQRSTLLLAWFHLQPLLGENSKKLK